MDFLLSLLVTIALVAIVVLCAIGIYRWVNPPEGVWALIVRIVMGLFALVVLIGFITGRIPLIPVRL